MELARLSYYLTSYFSFHAMVACMSRLTAIIHDALSAIGAETEARLNRIIGDFDGFGLGDEERLSTIATVIAAIAAIHHSRHRTLYVEAVRCWSLEISSTLLSPPRRLLLGEGALVDDAEDRLLASIEGLLDHMIKAGVGLQNRLVAELGLMARLLGQHDVGRIHLAVMAVAEAIGREGFQPGSPVLVSLRDAAMPITRETRLERVAPRGMA
jgi:hypothetical protein